MRRILQCFKEDPSVCQSSNTGTHDVQDFSNGGKYTDSFALIFVVIIGPPNGIVLFCSLASVVVVCNTAGGRANRRARRRPTLHASAPVLGPKPRSSSTFQPWFAPLLLMAENDVVQSGHCIPSSAF